MPFEGGRHVRLRSGQARCRSSQRAGDTHKAPSLRETATGSDAKRRGWGDIPALCMSGAEGVADVVEAHLDGVEGIAVAAVLLDDVPLTAAVVGGGHDILPVEIAVADFGKGRAVFGGDLVVLHVEKRHSALEFAAPVDRIATAVLDPVGVGLALEVARVGFLVENVEYEL